MDGAGERRFQTPGHFFIPRWAEVRSSPSAAVKLKFDAAKNFELYFRKQVVVINYDS